MNSFSAYATVILDVSVNKPLEYGLTEEQEKIALPGMRVEVPVRGHLRSGYIYQINKTNSYPNVKGIASFKSDEAIVTSDLFSLAVWMAEYYCASLQEVIQIMLPAGVRKDAKHKQQLFVMRAKTREELRAHCEKIRNKSSSQAAILDVMLLAKKGMLLTELLEEAGVSISPVETLAKQGLLKIDIVRIDRSPLVNEEYFKTKQKTLNDQQAAALNKIIQTIDEERFEAHLLYGVTGSGKTEIYLQAIDKALKKGKSAILLVPEISLTSQTIERFRSRFDDDIAVLHHRLSPGERFDEWHRIRRGDARIVIGARSAIFSPVKNLGILIIDEEHEPSYKQSEGVPCYHARDVAVMRGKLSKCAVVLGSATPSLESYYNTTVNKYSLSVLQNRADSAASLPSFTIIDMNREYEKNKGYTSFSETLLNALKQRIEKGEQSILFLNRRGYHTTLLCQSCKQSIKCPHCDTSLTFHLGDNCLSCHLCTYAFTPPPNHCPGCQSPHTMKFKGVGTEQVQKALHAILPEIRTLRMDADTTRHKGSHQKLLRDFGSGKADVLIGTQMITKGLHFPEVTLVGVLNSDTGLNIPDFRAAESTFQLITQVAGRAGRGMVRGEVIVQTLLPDNATIKQAASQDYLTFYQDEMRVRKLFGYPPFTSLVKMTFSGNDAVAVRKAAEGIRTKLAQLVSKEFYLHEIGPSGYPKIKDNYRFQLIVKGPNIYPISRALAHISAEKPLPRSIRMLIDVNPSSTFF